MKVLPIQRVPTKRRLRNFKRRRERDRFWGVPPFTRCIMGHHLNPHGIWTNNYCRLYPRVP
jgi:hypothetical protein